MASAASFSRRNSSTGVSLCRGGAGWPGISLSSQASRHDRGRNILFSTRRVLTVVHSQRRTKSTAR